MFQCNSRLSRPISATKKLVLKLSKCCWWSMCFLDTGLALNCRCLRKDMRECRAVGAPGSCFQKSLLIGGCALHPEHTWILIKFGIYTGPFKDLVVYCFHFQDFEMCSEFYRKHTRLWVILHRIFILISLTNALGLVLDRLYIRHDLLHQNLHPGVFFKM